MSDIGIPCSLVKGDGGFVSDVEAIPVEQRLLGGLFDGDLDIAIRRRGCLGRGLGPGPIGGVGVTAGGVETTRA